MVSKVKTPRKLERHFKGIANHRRIHMLLLIARRPEISLENIVDEMQGNEKTLSEHARRLVLAGLVEKAYAGRNVQHTLTPYGEVFVSFIKTFSRATG